MTAPTWTFASLRRVLLLVAGCSILPACSQSPPPAAQVPVIEQQGPASTSSEKPVASQPAPARPDYLWAAEKAPAKSSPLDKLDPAKIAKNLRPDFELKELVGVLADQRRNAMAATCVTFSADGRWIASANEDKIARVWDATTLRESAVLGGHTGTIWSAVLAPEGNMLATASQDKTVRLWDLGPRPKERARLEDHTQGVSAVAFSPDGKVLASGAQDNLVLLWEQKLTAEKPSVRAVLEGHTLAVTAVAFSPDSKLLASACVDGTIRLWDMTDLQGKQRAVIEAHENAVNCLGFAPGGQTLISGGQDKTVRIWDLSAGTPRQSGMLTGHTFAVHALACSPDGAFLATVAKDNRIILWDPTGARLRDWPMPEEVSALAFAPDSRHLALANQNGTIYILRLTGP